MDCDDRDDARQLLIKSMDKYLARANPTALQCLERWRAILISLAIFRVLGHYCSYNEAL
jgi:hypothetical protein